MNLEGTLFVNSFDLDTAALSQEQKGPITVFRGLKLAHFCMLEPSAEVIAAISYSNKQLILVDTVT